MKKKEEYKVPGQDCQCYAYSEYECACGADWTDPVIYKQRKELRRLETQLMKLKSELKILQSENTTLKNKLERYEKSVPVDDFFDKGYPDYPHYWGGYDQTK
jgi:hypothetical protein